MNYDEFIHKLEQLNEDTDTIDIYTSPDFQCNQTGGFPTMLCVNWDKGKAWLQINELLVSDNDSICRRVESSAGERTGTVTRLLSDLLQPATPTVERFVGNLAYSAYISPFG